MLKGYLASTYSKRMLFFNFFIMKTTKCFIRIYTHDQFLTEWSDIPVKDIKDRSNINGLTTSFRHYYKKNGKSYGMTPKTYLGTKLLRLEEAAEIEGTNIELIKYAYVAAIFNNYENLVFLKKGERAENLEGELLWPAPQKKNARPEGPSGLKVAIISSQKPEIITLKRLSSIRKKVFFLPVSQAKKTTTTYYF